MHNSSSFDKDDSSFPFNSFTDIKKLVQSGATSDCYKVRIFSKWHFLKRPKKEFAGNPIYIAAFEKEFDLGFTLDHPNIVRYLTKNTDTEGVYILTEFIDGLTLTEFISQYPDFFKQKENVRKLLSQILSALSYLQSRQIVHLDLKPDNILITRNGCNVKLIDLGMSYSDYYSEIIGGSRNFGSPEQFEKSHLIDYRCDMYAFGKLILYAVAGNTNVKAGSLPKYLRNIVNRCLIEDVNQRKITADECLRLLNRKNNKLIFILPILVLIAILFLLFRNNNNNEKEIKQVESKQVDSFKSVEKERVLSIPKKEATEIKQTELQQTKQENASQPTDSLFDVEIRKIIRKRLKPNASNLEIAYSDINEFNYDVLFKSFKMWEDQCLNDCKLLYEDYSNSVGYEDFEKIYLSELKVINDPIKQRFSKFKRN